MKTPTKMVDILSQAFEFVKLEDDRRVSRRDRSKERSDRYKAIGIDVSTVKVLERQNRLGGRPQSRGPAPTSRHFIPMSTQGKNKVPDPF